MDCKIIQISLNHTPDARDLLLQHMAEHDCGLAIVSEPYGTPTGPNWVLSLDGSAAMVRRGMDQSPP